MRLTKSLLCISILIASISFGACGYKKPSYEEVESSMDSPSGEVTKESTGDAWKAYKANDAKKMATDSLNNKPLTVDGFAPVTFSSYLNNAGIPSYVLPYITPYLPNKNDYTLRTLDSNKLGNMSAKQIASFTGPGGCLTISGKMVGNSREGSITFNMDKCSNGTKTGTVTLRMLGIEMNGNAMKGEIIVSFKNVCSGGSCINGEIGLRSETQMALTGGMSGKVVYGYNIHRQQGDNVAHGKGGLRLSYNTGSQQAKLEALVYAKVNEQEVTYVLEFARENETASFSIRGKNGIFTCSTQDGGHTGSCKAKGKDGEFSWSRTK